MRQLLYASNTARDIPDSVLADILAASRKNNVSAGITGILLYLEGGFMQVLEGDDEAVAHTYATICKDKRHWSTSVLLDRDAPRAFGEWSMGFERVSAAAEAQGMFAITRDALNGKLTPGAPGEILALLRTFYRVNS